MGRRVVGDFISIVDYSIIGGYAVIEYSEPRATKDLDILY
jgi:hypothetical protein